MNKKGIIYGINGPVIYLKGNTGLRMSEMVHVGEEHLVGEVISLSKKATTVQVFEETTGLKPGAEVVGTGDAISVTLGPGILNNIFDGIERPLSEIAARSGKYITRGVSVDSLDTSKKWNVHVTVSEGDHVTGGTVIAETQETASILHRSMVPPDVEGTVIKAAPDGAYTIVDPIVTLELADGTTKELSLCQKWPIRVPRPTKRRFPASKPLITGQRILDTMFPIAKGGTAAVPGGFGTGKTMTQHQIAKWSDADIIIYIGCGERGNEMTQVLEEFGELVDPKTGHPLMNRTALIANTSNMPVAAREASIYTGLTLAEYYRDMGYDVAIMAEGYTEQEMDLFYKDAQTACDALFSHEPFKKLKNKFNVVAVASPSQDSGVSVPGKGEWKSTAVSSHFNTFYSDRYLTTSRVKSIHNWLAGIPYEHIIILANTDTYGGGGIYNSYTLTTAHHPMFKPVVVHEFGHSFGGLADEYAYTEAPSPQYPYEVEPWEQNITSLVDFESKWKDMIPAHTPIPTPVATQKPDIYNKVGVYEGAGYTKKGIYRPVTECRMKINEAPAFCPVCQRALERLINFYTEK